MTTMTTKDVEKLLVKLTDEQKQLLKDAINFGSFGDGECRFYNENNELDYYPCYGFCANDAKKAGNFSGRKISAMFRSIYSKLCDKYGKGKFFSHISDAWGDGSGDMFYIKTGYYYAFIDWAEGK